jgi:sugar phosphate isomerase/epimerase
MQHLTRRHFLQASGTVTAATLMSGIAQATPLLDRIGFQLYTAREAMSEDLPGTLQELATIGYREVEFAGYFKHSPQQIADVLAQNGLSAPSAHVSLKALSEQLDEVLEAALTIGHDYLVLPWLSRESFSQIENYEELAAFLNKVGKSCQEAGLAFAYHNHDFEFEMLSGKRPYDLLLEQTDPALVHMELDLYWVARSGIDPRNYLQKFPGRFPMVHVKDMDKAGNMVDVGAGSIDFFTILTLAKKTGTHHFFVEFDRAEDAFATARNGYRVLRNL